MTTIAIFIVLTLLWPAAIVVTIGKKYIIPYIVCVFILFFFGMNAVAVFYENLITIRITVSFLIIISLIPLGYFGWKRKCWSKENLKESFKWLWTLYLMLVIAILCRLFFNHINSDTLDYASYSTYAREGTFLTHKFTGKFYKDLPIEFIYRTPAFYHVAGLVKIPFDFFSIYGEVLMVMLFTIGINAIIREMKDKSNTKIGISAVIMAIIIIFALEYKTSSVNWHAVSIALLYIYILRKQVVLVIMTPLALTVFSFSPLLTMPIALVFIVLNKKWTLREILLIGMVGLLAAIFGVLAIVNVEYKYFLALVPLMIIAIGIYLQNWTPKKDFHNPLYKIKFKKVKNLVKNKKSKLIIMIIFTIFMIGVEIFEILMATGVIKFPLIIGGRELWLITLIPIAVLIFGYDTIINAKVSPQFIWVWANVLAMILSLLAMQIPGVPHYILDRVSLPFSMSIVLFAMLRLIELDFTNIKKNFISTIGVSSLFIANLVMISGVLIPSPSIYSPLSLNIEKNYRFLTSKERSDVSEIIETNPDALIYSDIAVATVRGVWNEHSYFTNEDKDDRHFYQAEMKDRVIGFPQKYIRIAIKEFIERKYKDDPKQMAKELLKLSKETREINFKKANPESWWLYESIDALNMEQRLWGIWDQEHVTNPNKAKNITTFLFRDKNYANIVAKHYNKKIIKHKVLYEIKVN